eukprot:3459618-Rhodomonas_salina.2
MVLVLPPDHCLDAGYTLQEQETVLGIIFEDAKQVEQRFGGVHLLRELASLRLKRSSQRQPEDSAVVFFREVQPEGSERRKLIREVLLHFFIQNVDELSRIRWIDFRDKFR